MKAQPSNWNIANVLTVIRIVLVPVFGSMLLTHPHEYSWRLAATGVFVVAMLTDFADGKIARAYNLVTDFGKLWDPVADKALTGMAFVGLSIIAELPWWITITILAREWGITWLRAAIYKYGVMPANRGGKLKTLTQAVALIMFCALVQTGPSPWNVIAWAFMIAALVLTIVTGLDYLRQAARIRAQFLATGEKVQG